MPVATCQQTVCGNLEVVVEHHGAIFHIVDVSTYTVHAVGGFHGDNIVYARLAEYPVRQVNSLIAAIAEEYVVLWYTFHLRQFCL